MSEFIQHLIQFIIAQGAFGVFIASIIEEIVVPIPSTIIQTGAGFLLLADQSITADSVLFLIGHIALPAAVGATLGSLVIYGLVYWGEKPFVHRFGGYFFLTQEKLDRAKEYVLRHKSMIWIFCFVRFIPILPSVFVAGTAGLIRLPLRIYLVTTFIGMFIRGLYLGFAGWFTGSAFSMASSQKSPFEMFIWFGLGVVVISTVTMIVVFYVKKKNTITD